MISIELKNENDVRLPLVVWGNVALDLSEAIQLLSDKTLICVLKFGKIKVWKGLRIFINMKFLYMENYFFLKMSEAYAMHTMCPLSPLILILKKYKILPNCYQRTIYLWQLLSLNHFRGCK